MTELQFKTELYSAEAIEKTLSAFAPFATIERDTLEGVEVLRITAHEGVDERNLTGEIGNYVLGATVDARQGGGR